MSTTTIRLPDELRVRVETVAAAAGSSMHAFMLDAIAEATTRMERQQDFHAECERRLQHMQQTGEHLTPEDLRTYAMALARGEKPAQPEARTMAPEELARFRAAMQRAG